MLGSNTTYVSLSVDTESFIPEITIYYIRWKAVNRWKILCREMGSIINDDCLYTFLFADDPIVVSLDEQTLLYMVLFWSRSVIFNIWAVMYLSRVS